MLYKVILKLQKIYTKAKLATNLGNMEKKKQWLFRFICMKYEHFNKSESKSNWGGGSMQNQKLASSNL